MYFVVNDDIGEAIINLAQSSGIDVNSTLIFLYNYYVSKNHK